MPQYQRKPPLVLVLGVSLSGCATAVTNELDPPAAPGITFEQVLFVDVANIAGNDRLVT